MLLVVVIPVYACVVAPIKIIPDLISVVSPLDKVKVVVDAEPSIFFTNPRWSINAKLVESEAVANVSIIIPVLIKIWLILVFSGMPVPTI